MPVYDDEFEDDVSRNKSSNVLNMLANKLIDLFVEGQRMSFVDEHTEQTKVISPEE